MSKKNGGKIHLNRLVPSLRDTIALADAVESRFIELCNLYLRTRGEQLIPPASLDRDMFRWREMRVRHQRGDFRNTQAEVLATRAIAQWLLDWKKTLCGQEPVKLDWGSD